MYGVCTPAEWNMKSQRVGCPLALGNKSSIFTCAGADVLSAYCLPHKVILVESGAIFCHHHRLGGAIGPNIDNFRIWVSICRERERKWGKYTVVSTGKNTKMLIDKRGVMLRIRPPGFRKHVGQHPVGQTLPASIALMHQIRHRLSQFSYISSLHTSKN